MQTEKTNETKSIEKKSKRRIILWILIGIVILIIAIPILLPSIISSKTGNKIILDKINASIDGQVKFSSLSMGWWKGITIDDLAFRDNIGQIILSIKQFSTKPYYFSLLSKAPAFGQTIIDQPVIEVNLKETKVPPSAEVPAAAAKPSGPPMIPVSKIDLAVNNGQVKVTAASGQTVALSDINTKLNLNPPGEQTTLDMNMNLSSENKQSKVAAEGKITPKKEEGWSLKGASGNINVECSELDIETLGPLLALAGVDIEAKGNASANLNAEIKDGQIEKVDGFVKGRGLDINVPALKGDRLPTKVLDINAKLSRKQDLMNIEELSVSTDWLKAEITGSLPTTFESFDKFLASDTQLQANFDCQIGTILAQMPHTFSLKEGMKITSGSLKGNLATLTESGKRTIEGKAALTGLAGNIDGKNISLSPVNINALVSAADKEMKFDKVEVSSSFVQLNGSGTTKEFKYAAAADLSKLQAELGQFVDFKGYNLSGTLSQQADILFGKDTISLAGNSLINNFAVSSKNATASEPKADITFQMAYHTKDAALSIKSLNTNASMGKINISDSVVATNNESKTPMRINLSARSLDFQKIQPFAVIFASMKPQAGIYGLADSDVVVSKKDNLFEIKTDNTKISNLRVTYPGQKDFTAPLATLAADAKFNPVDFSYAINGQVNAGQINIKGQIEKKLTANTANLKGNLDLNYDWASVSTLAAPFMPAGLTIEGKRKDTVTFSSSYPAQKPDLMLANMSAKAPLGFDKAQYSGLNVGQIQSDVTIDKGMLKLQPFSTTVNNGKLNFAANADLKTQPMILTTPGPMQIAENIQLTDEMAKQFLPFINPIFANAINVKGSGSFNCTRLVVPLASGHQNEIDIEGTISAENVGLSPGELLGKILTIVGKGNTGFLMNVHPTKFTLKNGFVSYENMQVDIGSESIIFSGQIGLDKTLNMSVTLPEGATSGLGGILSGQRLTIPLTGTIYKPKFDIEKFIQKQGVDIIKGILQDQLKKR